MPGPGTPPLGALGLLARDLPADDRLGALGAGVAVAVVRVVDPWWKRYDAVSAHGSGPRQLVGTLVGGVAVRADGSGARPAVGDLWPDHA